MYYSDTTREVLNMLQLLYTSGLLNSCFIVLAEDGNLGVNQSNQLLKTEAIIWSRLDK